MTRTNHSEAQRAAMKHNSLIGLAACIQKHARTISEGMTVSDAAFILANDIVVASYRLEQALRAERKS